MPLPRSGVAVPVAERPWRWVPGVRPPCPDHDAQDLHLAQSRSRGRARTTCSSRPARTARRQRPRLRGRRLGAPALLARAPGRAGRQGLSGVPGPAQAAAGLVVRDVPGLLRDPAYAPGYPAPANRAHGCRRARYGVSIGDLIGAGLLEAGEIVISAGDQGDSLHRFRPRRGTAGGRCRSSPGSRTPPGQGVTVIVTVWEVPSLRQQSAGWSIPSAGRFRRPSGLGSACRPGSRGEPATGNSRWPILRSGRSQSGAAGMRRR